MKRLLLVLALVASAVSYGETKTYTGADNGDWFADGNWDPAGVPTAADDVMIAGKRVKAQTGAITANSLTMAGESELHLGKATLEPGTIATIENDLSVTDGAKLYVYAGALTDLSVFADSIADHTAATAAIYANPTVVSVGGTFTVEKGAVVYPENEPVTGAAVFFKPADFVLAADGEINTTLRGWDLMKVTGHPENAPSCSKVQVGSGGTDWCWTYAFGVGYQYGNGAGYGGSANSTVKVAASDSIPVAWTSGVAYGNAFAPFLPGSPGGTWGGTWDRGPGSIVVLATGTVKLNGTLNANGVHEQSYVNIPGASGGGIWICGDEVSVGETATVTADGGPCLASYANGPGGGGRIAVCEVPPSSWDVLAAATSEPAGYVLQEYVEASAAGVWNSGRTKQSNAGTKWRITASIGKAQLVVASDPAGLRSEGVVYGESVVKCGTPLRYEAGAFGYLDDDERYSLAGWKVTGASGAEVATGTTSPAEFELANADDEPYTLTWLWDNREIRYQVSVGGPGTVTINGGQETSEPVEFWTSEDAGAVDALTATPSAGGMFVGWYGNVPGGKSTDLSATVSHAKGDYVAAVFVGDGTEPVTQTWIGANGARWDVASNWSPAGVPSANSDVLIESGSVYVPIGFVAHSVTIASGAKLFLGSGGSGAEHPTFVPYGATSVRFAKVLGDFTSAGETAFGAEGGDAIRICVFEFGGDLTLTGASKTSFFAAAAQGDAPLETNDLLNAATTVRIGGAFAVRDTAVVYPTCDSFSGAAVRFECDSFALDEGATVNATQRGWNWRPYADEADPRARFSGNSSGSPGFETVAYGPGNNYNTGAGHGARGAHNVSSYWIGGKEFSRVYGLPYAPFLPGSPNGVYTASPNVYYNLETSNAGGGVVWIKSARKATVNGTIKANGFEGLTGTVYGGASGGSVWLIASGLTAGDKATLDAKGGNCTVAYYPSSGGGGRVSVALGLSDEEYAALAAGEMPASLVYADTLESIHADVSGGWETKKTSVVERAPTGTVTFVKGSLSDTTVRFAGSPVAAIGPALGYKTFAFDFGSVQTFTGTSDGYGADPSDPENYRWSYAGYVVSNATEQIAQGDGRTFSIEMPAGEITVYWLWTNKETAVHVQNPQGADYGSVTIDGIAYDAGGTYWGDASRTVEIRAVPAAGKEFLYWMGEFPWGDAKTNPLVLSAAQTRRLMPVFRTDEEPTVRRWNVADGAKSKSWLDPNNWSPVGLPGLRDDVIIATHGACIASNNYIEVASLTIAKDATAYDMRLCIGSGSDTASHKFDQGGGYFASRVSPDTEEIALVVTGDVSVSNACELIVGYKVQNAHDRIEIGGNLALVDRARMLVSAGRFGGVFDFEHGAGFLTVAGAVDIGEECSLHLASERITGGSMIVRTDTLRVAEGGELTATGLGYGNSNTGLDVYDTEAPGKGFSHAPGAGYGGRGLDNFEKKNMTPEVLADERKYRNLVLKSDYGLSYGNALAPIHPGSCCGNLDNNNQSKRGGGLVRVHARMIAVDGGVTADPDEINPFGGSSGGGIWLTARDVTFGANALLSAHGGTVVNSEHAYNSIGGGGRISVCVGLSDEQIDALAATGKASGLARKGLAKFLADYPAFDVANIRLEGGRGKDTEAEELKPVKALADGTFRYVVPSGIVLIVR